MNYFHNRSGLTISTLRHWISIALCLFPQEESAGRAPDTDVKLQCLGWNLFLSQKIKTIIFQHEYHLKPRAAEPTGSWITWALVAAILLVPWRQQWGTGNVCGSQLLSHPKQKVSVMCRSNSSRSSNTQRRCKSGSEVQQHWHIGGVFFFIK